MYARNKRARAAPVGAIKASTSREDYLKSDIEAEARHEELTGINRAKFDELLHREAKEITDAQNYAIQNGTEKETAAAIEAQEAIAASLETIRGIQAGDRQ